MQSNFFSFLELNSIQCYSWGGGLSLSQISGIHQRFLLHLISYLGAPGVANEDNVQYCKKNWLHLAYQDQHTERVAVIEIIITAQFHWRAVEAVVFSQAQPKVMISWMLTFCTFAECTSTCSQFLAVSSHDKHLTCIVVLSLSQSLRTSDTMHVQKEVRNERYRLTKSVLLLLFGVPISI